MAPTAPRPVSKGARELQVILNDAPLSLPPKENGAPYYLMDLLEYTDIDFDHLQRPVCLEVNGKEEGFQHELRSQDVVRIRLL